MSVSSQRTPVLEWGLKQRATLVIKKLERRGCGWESEIARCEFKIVGPEDFCATIRAAAGWPVIKVR